jgi:hypothetical protein
MSEIWGFSVGDVEGILTILGVPSVTVLSGELDTVAFRRARSAQGYEEQDYLGYTVYSREAEPEDDTAKILPDAPEDDPVKMLPDAFGLIEGTEVDKGTKSLILMAGGLDYDAPESMSRVKAALAAYQDKSAIGYGGGIITSLSRSLGRVGSAFITDVLEHRSTLDKLEPEQREQINLTLGPGKLDAYSGLAMALQGYGDNITLEFVLGYDSSATAEKNIDVLKTRLAEWRDVMYYGKARSPWEVQDVRVEGSLLRAVVKLSEDLPQMFFTGMIAYSLQYAFLFSD